MCEPEPRTEKPDDGRYVEAGCGHEVYEGENIYTWEGGTLCPDCMEDKRREISLTEFADAFGATYREAYASNEGA